MSRYGYGITGSTVTVQTDALVRIALALETLAGCTGWVDEDGDRQHDGDTCPIHEGQDAPAASQYHADYPLGA